MTAFATPSKPNVDDYLLFLREGVGIGPAYLPDDSLWVQTTLDMAIGTVNDWINVADPRMYTIAVYNFGADRLLNFGLDEPGQCFFKDTRAALGLNSFSSGLISASADQGTSQSFEVIEAAKRMTITDLQMLRTPYGRVYLDIAQSYGSNIWGLTRGGLLG
jgi:hypothetical protein